mgnify:CR=1 FL=1
MDFFTLAKEDVRLFEKFIIDNTYGEIKTYEQYTQKFKDVNEIEYNCLYHPNEIFATLLSEWLIKDKVYDSQIEFINKFKSPIDAPFINI